MVQDLDMTWQALYVKNREAKWMRSCLSAVETALAIADRETDVVEATAG